MLSFRAHRFKTLTFLIFSMIALCAPSFAFNQTGWLTIISKGGGYTISMPGKPTELPAPFAMGDFRGVSHIQHFSQNQVSYSVSYVDLPIDPNDSTIAEKIFSAAKDDLLEKAHARPLDEKNLDLKGNPGREFKMQGYKGVITSRNYLVKNRLYQTVVVVGDNASSENVDRFFDSFSLTDGDISDLNPEIVTPPPPPPQQKSAPCSTDGMPKQVMRSEGVIRDRAINLVRPVYPNEAKSSNITGKIEVEIVIDEQGNVIGANARPGNSLLQQAAVIAARASTFKPTILCNVAIKTQGVLTYSFEH